MSSASKPSLTITNLCDDLLCEIFDRLTVKEVFTIQTVNKDFHRCAKKWLKTVDQLFIDCSSFKLRKTFGKPKNEVFEPRDGLFHVTDPTDQTLYPSLEKLLTVCTGISTINYFSKSITVLQLGQLISRCPNLDYFSFPLGLKLHFSDADWSRLIELIKNCAVHLQVWYFYFANPTSIIKQLKQLFTTAKIKSVCFIYSPESHLKTIELLDQSVKVRVEYWDLNNRIAEEHVGDLIFQRIDSLLIAFGDLQALGIRRFPNLSQLTVSSGQLFQTQASSMIEFPRLRSLAFHDNENDFQFISNFFATVNQLDQLEELSFFSSPNIITDDGNVKKMLAKTPNITKLEVKLYHFSPCRIPAFDKLFQLLSEPALPLQTVSFRIDAKRLANDIGPIIDSLVGFACRKTKTRLMLTYYCTKEPTGLEEKIKSLPNNVKIKWQPRQSSGYC